MVTRVPEMTFLTLGDLHENDLFIFCSSRFNRQSVLKHVVMLKMEKNKFRSMHDGEILMAPLHELVILVEIDRSRINITQKED
jgi:hypothetical protein